MITTDLGSVTAYAEAVAQGYTGTKEEFGKLLANYTQTAEKVAEDKVVAEQAMESAKASADRASTSEQNAKASEDAILQKLADAKTEVDASVEAGKKLKTDLDESIADSTKSKTALDESIKSANSSKTALDETVEQANALDTSLGSNIAEGTQLNKDITASGQKAVSDINSASTKALEDINATGAAKLDAVNKAAEAIVADREQITKNKTDITSLNEDLVDLKDKKITKFYASNLGETHITDSDNGKVQDMKVFGKSEQNKTTGAQLLPITGESYTGNGVTLKRNMDGSYTPSGTPLKQYVPVVEFDDIKLSPGTYFVSGGDAVIDLQLSFVKNGITYYKTGLIIVDGTETDMKAQIQCETTNPVISNPISFMLNKGERALPIEPYTGGIPSPSPEYPQEIKSVVNPTIKVCGKNLFNKNAFIKFDNVYIGADNAIASGNDNNGFIIKLNKGTYHYAQYTVYTDVQLAVFKDYPKLGNMAEHIIRNDTATPVNEEIVLNDTRYLFVKYSHRVTDSDIPQQTILDSILLMYEGENTSYEPYKEQSIQLPITLNAIPVQSGGNVTIDGQQYIADYVDVERGKVVRVCKKEAVPNNEDWILQTQNGFKIGYSGNVFANMEITQYSSIKKAISNLCDSSKTWSNNFCFGKTDVFWINPYTNNGELTVNDINNFLTEHPMEVVYLLKTPIEEELTAEQVQELKELATYYPVTNITVGSEQLYGYTAFNYPVSMANGWNYVKQQLNDNRDYIYDMDLQSAEAYVNSEYAVALTELEVM